jgi:hypothetical protein
VPVGAAYDDDALDTHRRSRGLAASADSRSAALLEGATVVDVSSIQRTPELASGRIAVYDFTRLCSSMDYQIETANNKTMYLLFKLCGNTAHRCNPAEYVIPYATGPAILMFSDEAPPCNLTVPECTDPDTGNAVCSSTGVCPPFFFLSGMSSGMNNLWRSSNKRESRRIGDYWSICLINSRLDPQLTYSTGQLQ